MGNRWAVWLIELWQKRPYGRGACRFTPSCSEYAKIAIQRYGLVKGIWMGLKRIARCNPFFPGGHDPVP